MVHKKKRFGLLTFVLLIVVLIIIRFVEDIDKDVPLKDRFRVTKVIDGDTFELKGGDRVRLLSIDTPEKGEQFYEEAKELLKKYTLNKQVELTYAEKRRDHYGRLLAFVYVDSVFVNKVILEKGLGYLYLFKDTESKLQTTQELLLAQQNAMDAKIGIWSITYSPEDYYINKEGSFRLHRPGCNSVKKLVPGKYRKFDNRLDGFRIGLSPCRNCKP